MPEMSSHQVFGSCSVAVENGLGTDGRRGTPPGAGEAAWRAGSWRTRSSDAEVTCAAGGNHQRRLSSRRRWAYSPDLQPEAYGVLLRDPSLPSSVQCCAMSRSVDSFGQASNDRQSLFDKQLRGGLGEAPATLGNGT